MAGSRHLQPRFSGRYTSVLPCGGGHPSSRRQGGMAEWTIAPVCKIGGLTAFTGSNPVPTTKRDTGRTSTIPGAAAHTQAHIAQSVERVLGKNEVIGSNPIVGSRE